MSLDYHSWNSLNFETGISILFGLIAIFSSLLLNLSNIIIFAGIMVILVSLLHYNAMKDSKMAENTLKEKDWSRSISSAIYAFLITGMIVGVKISGVDGLAIVILSGLGLLVYTYYRNS